MKADANSEAPVDEHRAPSHRSNPAVPTPQDTDDPPKRGLSELDALKLLLSQFQELREYVSSFVTVKTDKAKLALQKTSFQLVLTLLGFIVIAGLIVSANWFMLAGTAEGLSLLCGGQTWAGKLIGGFLWLAASGIGIWYAAARLKKASLERMIQKYEKRQSE